MKAVQGNGTATRASYISHKHIIHKLVPKNGTPAFGYLVLLSSGPNECYGIPQNHQALHSWSNYIEERPLIALTGYTGQATHTPRALFTELIYTILRPRLPLARLAGNRDSKFSLLPQEADESPERIDFLLSTIRKSIKLYRQHYAAPEHQALWDSLLKMVDTIAIFIRAQNAGVIIRCEELAAFLTEMNGDQREDDLMDDDQSLDEDTVDGDQREDEDEMGSDRLQDGDTMGGDPLQDVDSDPLQDTDTVDSDQPQDKGEHGNRSFSFAPRRRWDSTNNNTPHPKYVTELLTGILRGLGEPANISRIQKRTSDDVLRGETASVPWRRSSVWLVVRVALQTTIHRGTSNMKEYKSFMVLLLAEILRSGVENCLPGHILYCMRTKLSRRLFKVRPWAAPSLITFVHEVVLDTEGLLQDRWRSIQDTQMRAPQWAPDELDVIGDTSLNLKNCSLPAAVEANGFVALWDFERCVKDRIDEWVSRQISDQNYESACGLIPRYMTTYAKEAGKLYRGAPAEQSIMLLTLFELWMALDILAITSCPLLKDYSPEVPLTLYESLLLSKSESLARISKIQTYLRKRYHEAGIVDEETFAVKFFESSPSLQNLKCTIEEQAGTSEKLYELHLLDLEYRKMMKQAGFHTVGRIGLWHDREDCRKCYYKWRARVLKTVIREWPLPKDPVRAKIFVFERAVPEVFRAWRETTYWLLCDICAPERERRLMRRELYARRDLSRVPNPQHRISLVPELRILDNQGNFHRLRFVARWARLQWYNIAREISSENLSFQCEEVCGLISRAVWQIGCLSSDGVWEHHQVLQEAPFGDALLDVLEQLRTDIEGDWRQGITALTITTLASRLLASAVAPPIINKTYKILRKIRDTTLSWLHELMALESHAETEAEREKYQGEICPLAAICRSSFDVDVHHAGSLLRSPEDVAIFIECAIILYSHSPQETLTDPDPHLRLLLLRDNRLSCSMEELIFTLIQERANMLGVNKAISSVWSAIDPTCCWTRLPKPNDRWLTTAVNSQRAQNVYFNVLSGALLIDGKPPGRAELFFIHNKARQFTARLQRNPDAVPSDIENMDYVTKAHISYNSQLKTKDVDEMHFGWRDGRLILRSRSPMLDGKSYRVLELLPREIFQGDLPPSLVDDYSHWMELSTCQIELRPKETPWTSSRSNWHLRRTACSTWVMDKGSSVRLVDCQSHTAEMICAMLRPLEPDNNILITLARSPVRELRVDLPRFQLSFTLKGGKLRSLNFPGFEVDSNQSTGTMLGLRSQLVLRRSAPGVKLNCSRRVIIPTGKVTITSDGDHVTVAIDNSGLSCVKYCDYDVDVLLGRLVGDGSLFSTLFQSFLHAVTSYSLPDPLTSLSGVEEAIQILRSARCKSFQSLDNQECQLLHQLSALTPSRFWTWEGGQQINWNETLSRLPNTVLSGLRPNLFSNGITKWLSLVPPPVPEAVGETLICFPVLDATMQSGTALIFHGACGVKTLVYRCPRRLKTPNDLLSHVESWTHDIRGSSPNHLSDVRLGFNKEWLPLDMPGKWIPLYNVCRTEGWGNRTRFKMLFSLSALGYSTDRGEDLVPALLAFARYPEFRSIDPPLWPEYNLRMGYRPNAPKLYNDITAWIRPGEVGLRAYSQVSFLVKHLIDQWDHEPTRAPTLPSPPDGNVWLIDTFRAMVNVTELFEQWFRNLELRQHIRAVQTGLDTHQTWNSDAPVLPIYSFSTSLQLAKANPSIKYAVDLEASYNALHGDTQISVEQVETLREELYRDHQMYQSHLSHVLGKIGGALNPDPQSERVQEVMRVAGLWPKSTTRSLLHHLSFSSRSKVKLSPEWRNVLVCLAQSILLWQRSERLMRLGPKSDEFLKECSSYPDLHDVSDDWLLVQIDSNFLARPLQVDVARNMMFPRSQGNTILQLNMGEGKSIIVPKPLANQTFQSLVQRLSGLANRRIYCMPFSRAIAVKPDAFQRIYHQCMNVGGILVMQPEHVLSFKLTGVERQLSSARRKGTPTPNAMLELQRWLDANVRDILDESDEILAVKCQLVYTVGTQQPLGPQPVRWTTVQHVFSILRSRGGLLNQLASQGGLELEQRDGYFPRLRILRHEAGVQILKSLLQGIMQGESPDLPPFRLFHGGVRREAEAFIAQRDPGTLPELRNHCRSDNRLWSILLLLRGLFAHGILMYILSGRRWRVDYGLDLTRSLLAVPYRAKDVPALRAEFSHPDVCISLTYLSYYYCGLSYDQLDMCFEHIDELEDPISEYRKWVEDNCLVPDFLRNYSSFNPDDREQKIQHLYPAFERNPSTINFFLCQVVFPKEAKTFPQKLSTSGWDIAERRQHVTTGFSGTNDNRYLLPTSIQQDDIPAQLGTNAKVLNLMLQPENDHYRSVASSELLDVVVGETPQIRVLLDVGAQMLEYSNKELTSIWLSQVSAVDVDAAIFFSEDDEIFVIRRDGATEPFISSSYRYQLDRCLVYLDDSHTRGTDLKLPADYRAAVTLGPKVTKDRLVQGCMRMRGLGKGQSVLFLAPPDVDRKIRKFSKKIHGERIGVYDVLSWSIRETCAGLRRYSCDWREQGIHYIDRQCACEEFWTPSIPRTSLLAKWEEFWTSFIPRTSVLAKYWLRPELKSLEEMYGAPSTSRPLEQELSHPAADCREIKQRSEIFSTSTESWLVKMAEEQEREVTHEPEREPEAEESPPPPLRPARHRLHPGVVSFVRDGQIPPFSRAFISLFSSITILPRSQQCTKWSRNLLATSDFVTTTKGSNARKGNEFLRPVNWILSSIHGSMLVRQRQVARVLSKNESADEILR
ncbi:uncharacterized protein EI90DRAFT_3020979 [Cantharellus anzutake]|uniref:uncharacterized protein n=1 Tax=Cantharellus anzutake TaxID=1750568 RepID=UPI0019063EB4|nr:uncharacterized protein EI90DRAFT_3020979 [Cantharellus anzutake]KAF8318608.1 hypothetical protein EI90DRAFT_3020979 [Cantharellus anzutake]